MSFSKYSSPNVHLIFFESADQCKLIPASRATCETGIEFVLLSRLNGLSLSVELELHIDLVQMRKSDPFVIRAGD